MSLKLALDTLGFGPCYHIPHSTPLLAMFAGFYVMSFMGVVVGR